MWFYGVTRLFGTYTDVAGRFGNLNAGNAARWDYVADPSITQRSAISRKIGGGRVTAQLSPRNKVSGYYDYQKVCEGSSYTKDASQCRTRGDDWIAVGGFGTWSPESTHSRDNAEHIMQVTYSATVTSKLLLEAGASQFFSNWGGQTPARRARPGAVHPGAGAEHRRRCARAQHALPRLRGPRQQPPDAQHLPRVGLLRQRHPQLEGGLPGRV